jgi:hypothetical protein
VPAFETQVRGEKIEHQRSRLLRSPPLVMADAEDGKEVLGSLPRRRPNIESPRRAGARAAAQKASAEPAAEAPRGASRPELAELEQLAQASAKLAAGAAVAGLKLAGRAVGGLGRVVGR